MQESNLGAGHDEMQRHCRELREGLSKRFKTLEALFDYLEQEEKEDRRLGRARYSRRKPVKIPWTEIRKSALPKLGSPKDSLEDQDDEVMRRCREIRAGLNKRFKTVDALCDFIEQERKEERRTGRRGHSQRKPVKAPRSANGTRRKPAHKE